jgi:hypothetical protein
VVLPDNAVRVAFLEDQMVEFVAASPTAISQLFTARGREPIWNLEDILYEWP